MGVSTSECRKMQEIGVTMNDDCASFDQKGRIVWEKDNERPPIYEEKIYY